jgi:hypothetical protein
MPASQTDLRQTFKLIIQAYPSLGVLANDIATVEESCTGKFLSKRRASRWYNNPANFLVNGAWEEETDSRPRPLDPKLFQHKCSRVAALEGFLAELRKWKARGSTTEAQANTLGYSLGPSANRGLSLLFDPLVDFTLLVQWLCCGRLPEKPTVLVMSDFYPLGLVAEEMLEEHDWAQSYGEWFMDVTNWVEATDPTTRRLAKVLKSNTTGTELCDPAMPKSSVLFVGNYNILIWNFFPFFRGGFSSTGSAGLPPSASVYRNACFVWMIRFLKAVDAGRLLIATSVDVFPPARSGDAIQKLKTASDLADRSNAGIRDDLDDFFKSPQTLVPNLVEFYRIFHPYRWTGEIATAVGMLFDP